MDRRRHGSSGLTGVFMVALLEPVADDRTVEQGRQHCCLVGCGWQIVVKFGRGTRTIQEPAPGRERLSDIDFIGLARTLLKLTRWVSRKL